MADHADQAEDLAEIERAAGIAQVSARAAPPGGLSPLDCEVCGAAIPEGRRHAIPGVRRCTACQEAVERLA